MATVSACRPDIRINPKKTGRVCQHSVRTVRSATVKRSIDIPCGTNISASLIEYSGFVFGRTVSQFEKKSVNVFNEIGGGGGGGIVLFH